MRAIGVRWACVLGLMSIGMGCSSSESGDGPGGANGAALDCAWLASDNCWKTTASAADSCLPPKDESGVLSADGRTCSYASGAVVTFAAPLVLPVPDNRTWDFSIAKGGQTCQRHAETETGFNLTVGNQSVHEGSTGGLGLQIQCPNGVTYSNSNAFNLLNC